jgi:hypothetical protein
MFASKHSNLSPLPPPFPPSLELALLTGRNLRAIDRYSVFSGRQPVLRSADSDSGSLTIQRSMSQVRSNKPPLVFSLWISESSTLRTPPVLLSTMMMRRGPLHYQSTQYRHGLVSVR